MATKTSEHWGITATAPPIDAAEVESDQAAVEVMVMWGESVLTIEHVSPPRDVIVESIGADDEPLEAVVERGGRLFCVVPPGATGWVQVGDSTRTFAELAQEGRLTPHPDRAGGRLYELPEGGSAQVDHAGLSIVVRPTLAGKAVAATPTFAWRRHTWVGVSVGVHALLLVMFYFLPPHTSALSLDTIAATDRMVEYLDAAPEVVDEDLPEPDASADDEAPGDSGQAHEGETGDSGREDAPETRRRFAIQGDEEVSEMARERIEENMASTGAIGALAAMMETWNVPTSPFAPRHASGFDDFSAIGDLMDDAPGDSFGHFGLGMLGTGRGAGGTGQGTRGVGQLGTIGSCRGTRCGHGGGGGYGSRAGRLRGRQGVDVTPISTGARVMGGLSREAIRRVVRRNIRQVRFCYEQGLQSNPSIEGRVVISWRVDPTGVVQGANVASTSLGSAETEQCIADAVRRWTFPQPDGGMPVGVNYPFMLRSAE